MTMEATDKTAETREISFNQADEEIDELVRKIASPSFKTGTPIKGLLYRGESDDHLENQRGRYLTTSRHSAQQYAEQAAEQGHPGARVTVYEVDLKNPLVGHPEEIIDFLGGDDPNWTKTAKDKYKSFLYAENRRIARRLIADADSMIAKKAKQAGFDSLVLKEMGGEEIVDLSPVKI